MRSDRSLLRPFILVVDEAQYPRLSRTQLHCARLVATRRADGRFHLVKSLRRPHNFALSHFAEPVGALTLVRYIGANLAL